MKQLKDKKIIACIIVALLSLGTLIYFTYIHQPPTPASYDKFIEDLNNSNISKVQMDTTDKVTVTLNDNSTYVTTNPQSPTFKEDLLKNGIEVEINNTPPLTTSIPAMTLTLSVIIMTIFIMSNSRNNSAMSKVNAKNVNGNAEFNFDNVAGNEEAKESVKDIVDFLKNPEKYKKYGARMPKGIILYGDPGTGKTLLAKAVAGEANVPFFAMSGSDFVQMYVGVGAARIRDLFKKAKSHGKAVIFIDEIDAIGKKRGGGKTAGGNDERDQTLNALLTEMSGFGEQEGIIVMAATNRLDTLDPALLRPGRFDRHVEVSLPDVNARERILSLYLNNKPSKNINIKELAQKTSYFSGAKLENLVNEAAILAAKEDREFIDDRHLDLAYSIVMAGYEKNDRTHIKESDRKITAFHEAGHAILSMAVLPEDKVSKVTIIPTTKGAGGYTLTIPEDKSYHTVDYLKKRVMVLLAGRAAEEIIFGKDHITTGAHNDISQCTDIIKNMVTEYGMGETLGLLRLQNLDGLQGAFGTQLMDEFKSLADSLYEETKSILSKNKNTLEDLANELLIKESLDSSTLSGYIDKLN